MKIDPTLNLDSGLDGEIPLNDTPSKMERPSYKRDGFYGPTPFTPKGDPIIIALTIEQHCKWCGHSWLSFGGIYREFEGNALQGHVMFRNAIRGDVAKDKIDRVIHHHEEVPYCPHCLGTGDEVSGAANRGEGEAPRQSLPIFDDAEELTVDINSFSPMTTAIYNQNKYQDAGDLLNDLSSLCRHFEFHRAKLLKGCEDAIEYLENYIQRQKQPSPTPKIVLTSLYTAVEAAKDFGETDA